MIALPTLAVDELAVSNLMGKVIAVLVVLIIVLFVFKLFKGKK